MKKLAVLLAILVVCNTANAAVITFERAGETISMTPGESITLYVSSNEPLMSFEAMAGITGNAIATGAINPSDAAVYGWDPAGFPFPPVYLSPTSVVFGGARFEGHPSGRIGYVTVQYGSGTSIVSLSPSPFSPPIIAIDPPPGLQVFGSVTLVPEPVTLILLGLGGLFIRRRR